MSRPEGVGPVRVGLRMFDPPLMSEGARRHNNHADTTGIYRDLVAAVDAGMTRSTSRPTSTTSSPPACVELSMPTRWSSTPARTSGRCGAPSQTRKPACSGSSPASAAAGAGPARHTPTPCPGPWHVLSPSQPDRADGQPGRVGGESMRPAPLVTACIAVSMIMGSGVSWRRRRSCTGRMGIG
jgi:hypothetical protein